MHDLDNQSPDALFNFVLGEIMETRSHFIHSSAEVSAAYGQEAEVSAELATAKAQTETVDVTFIARLAREARDSGEKLPAERVLNAQARATNFTMHERIAEIEGRLARAKAMREAAKSYESRMNSRVMLVRAAAIVVATKFAGRAIPTPASVTASFGSRVSESIVDDIMDGL